MRWTIGLVAGACALLAGMPAQAGTRATYLGAGETPGSAIRIVVEATDGGGVRVAEMGAANSGVLTAAGFVVQAGARQAARIDDIAVALDRVAGSALAAALSDPAAPSGLAAAGPRSIGGVAGIVHRDAAGAEQLVASADPALASIGRALLGYVEAARLRTAPLDPATAAAAIRRDRALFTLGTPILLPGRLRLERVETLPIPASVAAVPATMDAATLERGMRAARLRR